MDRRTMTSAIGAGLTTVLVVGALAIELVGVAIVGVIVGVAAGTVALGLVASRADRLGPPGRSVLAGYAAFGYAILLLSALSYANVPGARTTLDVPVTVGIGVVVAAATAIVTWSRLAVADRHA